MKKAVTKIGEKCVSVVLLMFLLVVGVLFFAWCVLKTPVDFIRYRNTRYYKDTKKKYHWLTGDSYTVCVYECIKNEGLPIDFIRSGEEAFSGSGFFAYGNTLLITEYPLCYDYETEVWTIGEKDESVNLEEVVQRDIQACNELMGNAILNRAVIITDDEILEEMEIPENIEVLTVEKKELLLALQKYIADHP